MTSEKKENLTLQEAWAAMARGECVGTAGPVHRISGLNIQFWSGEWLNTTALSDGPYSTVPDPSKPKEPEMSEYERDREALVEDVYDCLLLDFIEKHFVRKK